MKNSKFFLLCTFYFLVLTPFLFSQEGVNLGTPRLEKPIISEDYVLMPGDRILITITGATNYSYTADITYEGKVTINMPVVSLPTAQGVYVPQYDVVAAIPIYNLSLKFARDSLTQVFSKYFRNVKVDITLLGMRTFVVFVAGEVKNPGSVIAYPIDRVSEVIRKAQGTTSIGSRSKIELRRGEQYIQYADLEKFERFGKLDENPYVQDGDIIYVPKMEKSVIVKGAVFGKSGYELRVSQLTAAMERSSEGLYELSPGERVTDFVSKAGGVTPWADLHSAYVQRGAQILKINLQKVLADKDNPENVEIQDGDILVVPSVNAIVYVQGQVVNPGSFPFQPNLKASDYIGLAGGPLAEANMSGAHVVRGGQRISVKKDPVITEGDRIYVPRQVFKFWQDYVEIGSVAATALFSYLTLRALTK